MAIEFNSVCQSIPEPAPNPLPAADAGAALGTLKLDPEAANIELVMPAGIEPLPGVIDEPDDAAAVSLE